jgi:hypothetical protein
MSGFAFVPNLCNLRITTGGVGGGGGAAQQRRCCGGADVARTFDDLKALKRFAIVGKDGKLGASRVDGQVCGICTEPLNIDGPLEALYEPIARKVVDGTVLGLVHNGCGHVFHRECIREWFARNPSNACPICRAKFEPLARHYLVTHDEVVSGEEGQMQRGVWSDGNNHFEGEVGAERLVRTEAKDGTVHHFTGERGVEHLVRIVYRDGRTEYFEGERFREYKVRVELKTGVVAHYTGGLGAETLVRVVFPDGTILYYKGEKGEEVKDRAVLPGGNATQYYGGEQDAERVVRTEHADGLVEYFEGEKDEERLVRVVNPDGTVAYDAAEPDAERVMRFVNPDGTVAYDEAEPRAEQVVPVKKSKLWRRLFRRT